MKYKVLFIFTYLNMESIINKRKKSTIAVILYKQYLMDYIYYILQGKGEFSQRFNGL